MRRRRLFGLMALCAVALCCAPTLAPARAQDDETGPEIPKATSHAILDRARVMKRPVIPADARNAGLSGSVAVRVTIDPDGEVLVARPVTGPERLRQLAVKALQSWEFAATSDPDPVTGYVLFRFSIGESWASIVGLREQDVAQGSLREPEPGPDSDDAESTAPNTRPAVPEPSANVDAPSSRPREVRSADRPPARPEPIRLGPSALNAIATRKVSPRYPPQATAARIEGMVTVEIDVDEQGHVTNARAVSGNTLLRSAAVEAARQWVFRPTTDAGAPQRVVGTLSFNFRL